MPFQRCSSGNLVRSAAIVRNNAQQPTGSVDVEDMVAHPQDNNGGVSPCMNYDVILESPPVVRWYWRLKHSLRNRLNLVKCFLFDSLCVCVCLRYSYQYSNQWGWVNPQ